MTFEAAWALSSWLTEQVFGEETVLIDARMVFAYLCLIVGTWGWLRYERSQG